MREKSIVISQAKYKEWTFQAEGKLILNLISLVLSITELGIVHFAIFSCSSVLYVPYFECYISTHLGRYVFLTN